MNGYFEKLRSAALFVHHFCIMVICITDRPKASPVCNCFECNQEGNSSKCKIKIVKSYEEKECDRTIKGKN